MSDIVDRSLLLVAVVNEKTERRLLYVYLLSLIQYSIYNVYFNQCYYNNYYLIAMVKYFVVFLLFGI